MIRRTIKRDHGTNVHFNLRQYYRKKRKKKRKSVSPRREKRSYSLGTISKKKGRGAGGREDGGLPLVIQLFE